MRFQLAALIVVAGLVVSRASADVQRFAVVVGNNQGLSSDAPLRYAEADARKVAGVLQELGGVEATDLVLLAGQDAEALHRALTTVNDRIRQAASGSETETVLVVYYSGHADAQTLHLAGSRFQMSDLAELVRGSAATFRVLVVDACRSGQLTRSKGGKVRAPFPLSQKPELAGQGLAFLTASAADEDAQESDALRGSFFTHALVSGLLGAADEDRDGSVVLEEAYGYAYTATLRATSGTAYGAQHPSFQYDFRGQGQLTLTQTRLARSSRGSLRVPPHTDALIFRDDQHGAVVAEVAPGPQARTLNLAAGAYFARVRATSFLLEGTVDVRPRATTALATDRLARVEYARLVRKGGEARADVHSLELGARARSPLPNAESACLGGLLGYRYDRRHAYLAVRAGYCESRFENQTVKARVRELDLGLRLGHAWDLAALTLELGAGGGAALFLQSFETRGIAPSRRSLRGGASGFFAASYDMRGGLYVGLDVEAQLYVLRLTSSEDFRAAFSGRSALLLGRHF